MGHRRRCGLWHGVFGSSLWLTAATTANAAAIVFHPKFSSADRQIDVTIYCAHAWPLCTSHTKVRPNPENFLLLLSRWAFHPPLTRLSRTDKVSPKRVHASFLLHSHLHLSNRKTRKKQANEARWKADDLLPTKLEWNLENGPRMTVPNKPLPKRLNARKQLGILSLCITIQSFAIFVKIAFFAVNSLAMEILNNCLLTVAETKKIV